LTTALYPGSFDPVTNGHLDIITRAAVLFDKLIIGIYGLPPKPLLFSAKERVELMKKAVAHLPNTKVEAYSELTVNFARRVNAQVIIRGIRMSADFEREFEMAMMNKKLAPDIEVVCLMCSLQYEFLSSSLLKEVAQLGGCIEDLVPAHVATALRGKLSLVAAIKEGDEATR
jgi:pantetheine-phosphate adenylyltransferase